MYHCFIPFYCWIVFHGWHHTLSIHQLIDTWVVSTVRLLWITLLWTFMCLFLYEHMSSFLLGKYREQNCWVMVAFWKSCRTVLQTGCSISHSMNNVWEFQFLHILANVFVSASYSHLSGSDVFSHCSFVFHFPGDYGGWTTFHVFIGHSY